ncbi:hypothetical protein Tco_0583514 [Tanacetum coccineum]
MQQIAASLEDKMTIKMNKMLNEMKALVVTTPAPVKAVEELHRNQPSKFKFFTKPIPFQTQGMEAKAIQLVSGVSYDGPSNSPPAGVEKEREGDKGYGATEHRRHPTSSINTHKKYLDFSDSFAYNNPSPHFDPMFLLHSTLTPFDESDFLLFEEADAFIAIDDEPVSPVFNATYYDPEGDILMLEALLNSRVTFTLPNKVIYFPENQRRSQIH